MPRWSAGSSGSGTVFTSLPFAYTLSVDGHLSADVLAKAKDGKLTIRLETEKGGLAVYGASFGRYPLDPTVSF